MNPRSKAIALSVSLVIAASGVGAGSESSDQALASPSAVSSEVAEQAQDTDGGAQTTFSARTSADQSAR